MYIVPKFTYLGAGAYLACSFIKGIFFLFENSFHHSSGEKLKFHVGFAVVETLGEFHDPNNIFWRLSPFHPCN